MVTTIKQPFQSPAIVLILNRIHEMDQPYASGIADSLGEQVTDIQTYLDTMHDHGWISKERQGRRQVLTINPDVIWQDSKYNHKITHGHLFSSHNREINDDLRQLLSQALLYKLFYAVETTPRKAQAESLEDQREAWVKGPDTTKDVDEMRWYGCNTTMNELLAEIVATIKTLATLTTEDDPAIDIYTSAYDTRLVNHCHDIIQGTEPVETMHELVQDMVENPQEYM